MISRTNKFNKVFKKIPLKIQERALERLGLLLEDEFNPLLNNHELNGEYEGCRSINVNSDWRIIYEKQKGGIHLLQIGTHSQLYE